MLIIDKILARGSTVMANRVRDLTAQVFNFAAMRDLIPSSPAAGLMKKPGGQEQAKERSLNREEIRRFWRGLDDTKTKISQPIRLALKLILVTAQRPGEVAQAKLNDIDVAQRLWRIGDNKSERPHTVPLTDLAIELIDELRKLSNGRPYLLPSVHSTLKPAEPISERALSRALRNNHVDEKLFGCEPFTPHDLRRTAATHMTTLGIHRWYVGKVLNHSQGAILPQSTIVTAIGTRNNVPLPHGKWNCGQSSMPSRARSCQSRMRADHDDDDGSNKLG